MRPEVSQLVQHFYVDGLIDHDRVTVYDRVGGVAKDVFFIDHREREQAFEGTSKRNEFEARYAAKLALYLVRTQQYNAEDITLLTPYIGQKRLIRSSLEADLRRSPDGVKAGTRVVTIDDYQGEENKIVILSLVRSNKARKIGFTGIENRVIVAMSRAKEGLYIIGNSEMFENDISWEAIICKLRVQTRIGPALTLQCRVHPEQLEQVARPEDFIHVKDGGCRLPCRRLLDRCGHRCPLNCHVFDHEQVCCDKPCNRARPAGCGHRCSHLCWECTRSKSTPEDPCPTPCAALVPVALHCGHAKRVRCHYRDDEVELRCHTQVIVKLPCGHDLRTSCYNSRRPAIELGCEFTRKVRLEGYGHEVTQKCHDVPKCSHRCDEQLSCGHPCPKMCYPAHSHDGVKCEEACEETLACGHFCDEKCGQPHTRLCQEECGLQCLHGYTCGKPCFELCVPCREKCPWKCPHHRCKKLCFEPCDRPRCDQPCPLQLECGHACQGLCGEPCPLCPVCYHDVTCGISFEEIGSARESDARIYTLPECGHTFYLDSLDQYMDYNPTRGEHQAIQLRACPVCREPIFTAPRYGNVIKAQVSLVARVKEKLISATRELTLRERLEVNAAMQRERGVLGAAAGHWYACPNDHPYFIADCGGANQVTRCPDCGASIGGTGYRIERGNRFMADFTGEGARPQWPNQGE
ncbi:hypothetical protein FOZ62_028407 [Perkinsus olseni]|uniref:RZ-type domain-containing protein n=2 Tax=Perkinsus olseni TaxID=32597 RepID=A0A7J6RF36_PEROL|nr:hypothetical protein FOZ62_028407 [Perkinsus olseni]